MLGRFDIEEVFTAAFYRIFSALEALNCRNMSVLASPAAILIVLNVLVWIDDFDHLFLFEHLQLFRAVGMEVHEISAWQCEALVRVLLVVVSRAQKVYDVARICLIILPPDILSLRVRDLFFSRLVVNVT